MDLSLKEKMREAVRDFRLPRYHLLPDVGLYLEQVVNYVNLYLTLCPENQLTPSMVSNYVKLRVIPGPTGKKYYAESLAYLIFVAYMKMILPLDMIRYAISVQRSSYELYVAYEYFCAEFENLLRYIYGISEKPERLGKDDTEQKELLRRSLLSIVHKIYLEGYIRLMREQSHGQERGEEIR